MSPAESLTELRTGLIRCSLALSLGRGVAWSFSGDLLAFAERPLAGHTSLVAVSASAVAAFHAALVTRVVGVGAAEAVGTISGRLRRPGRPLALYLASLTSLLSLDSTLPAM